MKMRFFCGILGFLFSTLSIEKAFSYPTTIRLGYVSCVACHHSTEGGDSLTDYGRGFSAQTSLFNREYEPSQNAFVKTLTLDGRIQTDIQVRPAWLVRGTSVNSNSQVFPMQLDVGQHIHLTDNLSFDWTLSHAPDRGQWNGVGLLDRLYFRRALISFRPVDGWEFSLGRDALPWGIKTEDHTYFVRSKNRRFVSDVQTLAKANYWSDGWIVSGALYLPSYQEEVANREWGATVRIEKPLLNNRLSVGLTLLEGGTPTLQRHLVGLFGRYAPLEKLGVLFETTGVARSLSLAGGEIFYQSSSLIEPFTMPLDWLEFSTPLEFLYTSSPFLDQRGRIGLNIKFRLDRRLMIEVLTRNEWAKDSTSQFTALTQAVIRL